ncbi:MAG: cytochrome c3 family protein [Gammaproteobacteria bacterium]|nr:cytochrome c3 family protein [Gammaproteobacteria bacterium]
MSRRFSFRHFIWTVLVISLVSSGNINASEFEDDQGCLLCHKYPKMGRITEDGVRRSYYVMPHVFGSTVHRNVPCTDCHNYIKELPHREVKQGVSCDTECHSIKNPATGNPFSHKAIVDKYNLSIHGRNKEEEGLDADKPYCVTCHHNPVYNPDEDGPPAQIVQRCVVCHEDEKFVKNWYKHTSRRINEVKRSPEEIVALCTSCHGDEQLVQRHLNAAKEEGRDLGRKFEFAARSYAESFHGKVTKYGFNKAANCLDCHADYDNYYLSVHEIRPSRDPASPVHVNRRVETCQRCHPSANENYALIDAHPTGEKDDNPFRYYAEKIYNWVGNIALVGLIGMAMIETFGRRRDGVGWRISRGSSWWKPSRRGRNRIRKK